MMVALHERLSYYIGMGAVSMMDGPWLSSLWISGLDGFRNLFLIEELLWKIGFGIQIRKRLGPYTTFEGGWIVPLTLQ